MPQEEPSLNKLTLPLVRGAIARERLFREIDSHRSRPVLWVTAPGGAGKTTLVAGYLASRALPSLWYQVDQGDTDIATFFYFLGLAAERSAPRPEAPLPLLTRDALPSLTLFSRRFFESLFARLPRPFALVFDNYQDGRGPLLHDVLYEGLDVIPEGITVIIVSRETPPARFARLQANGRVGLLGWDQIRFTEEESALFLRVKVARELPAETVRHLHRKTEGWVSGLLLMVEHARLYGVQPELWDAWTPESIFNYFAAEVFNRMDGDIREFLLATAFLPYLPVRSAERLSGNRRAGQILAELTRGNYFTTRRFTREEVYQYHQLFRGFLLNQVEETLGRDGVDSLRLRAAALLEEAGEFGDAVSLYCQADDWEAAAGVILRQAPGLLAQGRDETLREWLETLPAGMRDSRADLLYWHAASLQAVNPGESLGRFKSSFNLHRSSSNRTGMLHAWSAVADAVFYQGDYAVQRTWYDVLRGLLAEDPSFPDPATETRVTLSTFNVMAFTMADHPDIDHWHERAYALVLGDETAEINQRLMTGVHLWVYYGWCGNFARASVMEDFLVARSRSAGVSDLVRLVIMTDQVLFGFLTAHCEEGLRIAGEAMELVERTGINAFSVHVLGQAVSCALSLGDVPTADRLLEQMDCRVNLQISLDVALYHAGLAWKAALENDFPRALQHTRISTAACNQVGFLAIEGIGFSVLAEFLWEVGDAAEARRLLDQGYERAGAVRSSIIRFFCLLVDARISLDTGDEEAGRRFLAEAFTLARANGFVNKYMWRPAVMARLCAEALEAGIETGFVRRLIRQRNLTEYPPAPTLEAWPWPVRVYTLGRFELQVNGEPVRFTGKAQKKPLEMLKALVALGGTEPHEGKVAALLWPDSDAVTARNAVKTTLHRLRALLGSDHAVQVREGVLCLDRRHVWVDIWAFNGLLAAAQLKAEGGREEEAVRLTEKALDLYRGLFLPEERDSHWPVSCRKRLKSRFILHTVTLASLWLRDGAHSRALTCCLRGLEVDDLAEELYQTLMKCYLEAGLRGEAVAVYRRCRLALATHGAHPSAQTREIIRETQEPSCTST